MFQLLKKAASSSFLLWAVLCTQSEHLAELGSGPHESAIEPQGTGGDELACLASGASCSRDTDCCSAYCEARPRPGGMRYYCL